MLKIEIYISLERGQTSIRSYVTREFEEFLKGGKQMYEQSCAPTNQIRRWEDIDFVKTFDFDGISSLQLLFIDHFCIYLGGLDIGMSEHLAHGI